MLILLRVFDLDIEFDGKFTATYAGRQRYRGGGLFIAPINTGVPEVREASRNLPGACGFAPIEYEPMATHDDPIQAANYQIPAAPKRRHPQNVNVFL